MLNHLGGERLSFLDRRHVLFGLAEEPATDADAVSWAAAHLALLSRQSAPEMVIGLANTACSAADASVWKDALAPRIAGDANARLLLATTLETIRNCAALKARWSEQVSAALGQ